MISRCDFVSVRHSGSFSLPRDIIMPFQGLDVSVCTETTLHISLSSNQSQGLATLYPEVLGKLLGPKAGQIYRNHFWFHFCFSFLFFLERTMFLFLFYQHSLQQSLEPLVFIVGQATYLFMENGCSSRSCSLDLLAEYSMHQQWQQLPVDLSFM